MAYVVDIPQRLRHPSDLGNLATPGIARGYSTRSITTMAGSRLLCMTHYNAAHVVINVTCRTFSLTKVTEFNLDFSGAECMVNELHFDANGRVREVSLCVDYLPLCG